MSGRPEIPSVFWVQTFVIDEGSVAEAVNYLIGKSSIWHYISIDTRSESKVVIYRLGGGVPPQRWSAGEILLYGFILSLAGRAEINLNTVAAYFKHTDLREPILAALNAAFEQH